MNRRIVSEMLGAVLMCALGAFVTYYALGLPIGSLRRMGPGFLPVTYGITLLGVGLALGVSACFAKPGVEVSHGASQAGWRPWLFIPLGMVAFAVLMRYAGLVPAAFSVSFIGSWADRANSWRDAVLVGVAMVATSIVVFWWLLSVQIPLLRVG